MFESNRYKQFQVYIFIFKRAVQGVERITVIDVTPADSLSNMYARLFFSTGLYCGANDCYFGGCFEVKLAFLGNNRTIKKWVEGDRFTSLSIPKPISNLNTSVEERPNMPMK